MRVSIIVLAAATAAVLPAAALAQPSVADRRLENQLRAQQTQEQLRQYQQQAPARQAEQRLNDLDARVRTQQNIDSLTPPVQPPLQPMDVNPATITGGINLSAQSSLMAKELSAENDRLKALNPPR